MITEIELLRFKRFAGLRLDTRPLTVLSGTNGSGKTSVIHALLLARQAASGDSATVQLNGPYGLALGEAADVLQHDADPADGFVVAVNVGGARHEWQFAMSEDRSLVVDVRARPETPPDFFISDDRRFTYLSADRLGPCDTLPAAPCAPNDLGVGVRGEYVAHVLAVHDRLKVSIPRRHVSVQPASLQHQAEGWMATVARQLEIRAEWFPRSTITQIQYKTPGVRHEWVRPPNMGFGVSSVLPIIVAGLTASRDGLLIVENPEIHLHPRGQSAVGAFLAQVAADGVQVLVETHSDHVINGVRRAVAEGTLPASDCAIHYFNDTVTTITINDRGKLSEWPSGFFDQIDLDLGTLARIPRNN